MNRSDVHVCLDIDVKVNWLEPAKDTAEQVRRGIVEMHAKRMVFQASRSLKKVIEGSIQPC